LISCTYSLGSQHLKCNEMIFLLCSYDLLCSNDLLLSYDLLCSYDLLYSYDLLFIYDLLYSYDLLCSYDLLALTLTLLWLIAGTKFVLGLYDRINYVMHRPNNDVRVLI
jgi:hypothetical protein